MKILMVNNQIFSFEDMGGFLNENQMEGSVVSCLPGDFALDIASKCEVDMSFIYVDKSNMQYSADFFKKLKEANPKLYNMAMVQPENFGCLGEELENLIDDYIAVPIDPHELGLRMRKVVRQKQHAESENISFEIVEENKASEEEKAQTESACSTAEAVDLENHSSDIEEEADIMSDSIDAGLHDLRATCKAGNKARGKNVNKNLIIALAVSIAALMAYLYSKGKFGGII